MRQTGGMTVTLHLPEQLAGRLEAEASRRGVSVEELSLSCSPQGWPKRARWRRSSALGTQATRPGPAATFTRPHPAGSSRACRCP